MPDLPRPVGEWVPAPSYLLRRWAVRRLVRDIPPGRFVEIGPGAGNMLRVLSGLGHMGTGIELSEDAVRVARASVAGSDGVTVEHADFSSVDLTGYDLVLAFEVLEHLEDEQGALRKWNRFLRFGGLLLLSVPAHMRMWNPADEVGGHLRRYEKERLMRLVQGSGFSVEVLWCYGFPLANVLKPIQGIVYARRSDATLDQVQRTKRSGLDRRTERHFRFLLHDWVFYPFFLLQALFFRSDLGTGYLLKARKVGEPG